MLEEEKLVEEEEEENPDETQPSEPEEKTLTQSQVNEIVGRMRQELREKLTKELTESIQRSILERYGVESDDELNDVFGKGQAYESLNDDYTAQCGRLKELSTENALLKSKADPDRWEDIKLILSGKGLEVSEDNIIAESETHPEWFRVEEPQVMDTSKMEQFADNLQRKDFVQPKKAVIKKLGNDPQHSDVNKELDEEALVNKYFFHK